MKTSFACALLFVVALSPECWAAPKKKAPAPVPEHKIFQVDGASITLSIGSAGGQHETFKITSETKVTLNGVPTPAHDLKAGMVASVVSGHDKTTAQAIHAKDAPRHPKKGRTG